MKKFPLLVAVPMVIAMTTHFAAADTGCEALQTNIEKQIDIAKANESDNEAQGYQKALDAIKEKCDVAGLTAQAQNEIMQLQRQVSQTQTDASAAELSLTEALNENDEEKIAQFEERVGEKQQELMELQDTLEITQAQLQALTNTMGVGN